MAESAHQQKVAGWFLQNWEWPLTLLCAAGAFLLYRDYGIGWDSEAHALYGESILDYFLHGLKQAEETKDGYLPLYGWLFDLPSAALHRALGLDKHALRGLLSALFAVATLPAIAKIARRIGGDRLAILATACLIVMPQFFGQAFINPKDLPLACTVTWAVLAICRLVDDEQAGWPGFLALAIAFGAVLSTRVGGLFVFVFLGAAVGWRLLPAVVAGGWRQARPRRPGSLALKSLTTLVVIWALMVSAWPFAHSNPLMIPLRAFRMASTFPDVYGVLFNGRMIGSDALPFTYLPTYLALNLPPVLLGLVLIGGWLALGTCVREWRRRESGALFLVLFWIGFTLLYVMIRRPVIYDGARHFIFVLPALAILGGVALDRGWGWLARRGGSAGAGGVFAVLALLVVLPLYVWHPYQYAYLNLFAGPRAEVQRRFETDYWKTSYKAAAEWLNGQQELSPRPLQVMVAATDVSYVCLVHFLDPRIKWQMTMEHLVDRPLPPGVDYYISIPRYGLDENFGLSPVVWEERRGGVLLCVIRSDRHVAK